VAVARASGNNGILATVLVWASLMLHAFFLSFLFMPLHEATHKTAFKSPWANEVLAWVTGFLTVRPPKYYLVYHFPHHHYTGDPKRDPELIDSLIDLKMNTVTQYIIYMSGIAFWADRFVTNIRLITGTVTEPWVKLEKNKKTIVMEARYLAVIYIVVALQQYISGSTFVWNYWLLPSILAQPFLRFYLIAEHTACQTTTNMMDNTRTTYTNWFYRKLAWNMPWHAEHHAFPQVPFYALDKVHELVKKVSVEKSGCQPSGKNGYLAVNRGIIASILNPGTNH